MHYYTHHIGDYKRDTSHLSLIEHGIYRQLLDLYYLTENPLDANALRLIGCRTDSERELAQTILNEFFQNTSKGYVHKRCENEINRIYDKSEKARASAKARWNKDDNANVMRTHSEGNADGMLPINPIPNTQEPINKKHTPLALLVSMGIPESIAKDWLSVRKLKKLAPTKAAFTKIKKHAEANGFTFVDAITICCEQSWGGFNVEWTKNLPSKKEDIPEWKRKML